MIGILLSFIIPICVVVIIAAVNSLLFNRRFEAVVGMSIIEMLAVLYIMGFINLRIGIAVIIIVLVAVSIYILKKNSGHILGLIRRYVTTPLFYTFLILYLFVFVINLGKQFSHWDEISHWGMMAKDLYYTNRFYIFDSARLTVHNEYPPLMALIEYLWCWLGMGFSERSLYSGKIVFCFAMLISLFCYYSDDALIESKKIFKGIVLSIALILVPLFVIIGEATFYRTIYAESVMAILFVTGFYEVIDYDGSTFDNIRLSLTLFALTLVKQIAIVFTLVIAGMYIIRLIYNYGVKRISKLDIFQLTPIFITFLSWISWKIATGLLCNEGQFDVSHGDASSVITVLLGRDTSYKSDVLSNYLKNLTINNLPVGRFNVSYAMLAVLMLLAIAVVCMIHEKRDRIVSCWYLVIFVLFYVVYAVVMLISYIYGFSEAEATRLACFERYMNTTVFCGFLIFFVYVMRYLHFEKKAPVLAMSVVSIIALLVLIDPSIYLDELQPGFKYDSSKVYFEGDAEYLVNNTDNDSKIFVIYQDSNGSANNWIRYLAYPRTISDQHYSLGEVYGNDTYTINLSHDEWVKELSEYDYLYLGTVNDTFLNSYSDLFEDKEYIVNQALFRIETTDNTTKIKYISKKE